MAHPLKGVGSFVIVIVLAYLAIRYWANIKTATGPPGARGSGGIISGPGIQPANVSSGKPGDPAYALAFGGSGGSFGADNPTVSSGAFTGFVDRSSGRNDYLFLSGGTDPNASAFGSNCSTDPTDHKPICP